MAVQFWAKGREDEAWYGAKHLQPMTKSDYGRSSNLEHRNRWGCWRLERRARCGEYWRTQYGTPESTKSTVSIHGRVRRDRKYAGHFEDLAELDPRLMPSDDLVMAFGRCTHLAASPAGNSSQIRLLKIRGRRAVATTADKMFCICYSSALI